MSYFKLLIIILLYIFLIIVWIWFFIEILIFFFPNNSNLRFINLYFWLFLGWASTKWNIYLKKYPLLHKIADNYYRYRSVITFFFLIMYISILTFWDIGVILLLFFFPFGVIYSKKVVNLFKIVTKFIFLFLKYFFSDLSCLKEVPPFLLSIDWAMGLSITAKSKSKTGWFFFVNEIGLNAYTIENRLFLAFSTFIIFFVLFLMFFFKHELKGALPVEVYFAFFCIVTCVTFEHMALLIFKDFLYVLFGIVHDIPAGTLAIYFASFIAYLLFILS